MYDCQGVAEESARALLLAQHPPRLPVRVDALRFDRDIFIDSVEHFCESTSSTVEDLAAGTDCLRDGCTLILPGQKYIILYNGESKSLRRRNFTLAHELGHIFLGHTQDSDPQEKEANRFSAELIAPRVLAREYLSRLPKDLNPESAIAEAFFMSREAARVRLRTLGNGTRQLESENALLGRYSHLLPGIREPVVTW